MGGGGPFQWRDLMIQSNTKNHCHSNRDNKMFKVKLISQAINMMIEESYQAQKIEVSYLW